MTNPVTDIVATLIENAHDDRSTFIPGRFPFTYAYDFFRAHSPAFIPETEGKQLSRGDASMLVRKYTAATGQDYGLVLETLAVGYLKIYNVKGVPDDFALRSMMHEIGINVND